VSLPHSPSVYELFCFDRDGGKLFRVRRGKIMGTEFLFCPSRHVHSETCLWSLEGMVGENKRELWRMENH
jgi:hypothetical protein